MIGRQQESSSILEESKRENRALLENVRRLERQVEKTRAERDASDSCCLRLLQVY